MTNDAMLLAENFKLANQARDMFTRASLGKTQNANQLLASATPEELASLFEAPSTERQAELQRIVQGDVNARERGLYAIPTYDQKLKRAQAEESIYNSRDSRAGRAAQLGIAYDNANRAQFTALSNAKNQQLQRAQAERAAAATEAFRRAQLENADANRGQRASQIEFQNMMALEKMLQDKLDEEYRQSRGIYQDAAAAAAAGAIDTNEVRALFGDDMSPTSKFMIEGYAGERERQLKQEIEDENALLQQEAARYNNSLSELIDSRNGGYGEALRDGARFFGNKMIPGLGTLALPQKPPQIATLADAESFLGNISDDKRLAGRIIFDQTIGKFVPRFTGDDGGMGEVYGPPPPPNFVTPTQAPQQAQPLREPPGEGAVIRRRSDGAIFQIRNGQQVRLR